MRVPISLVLIPRLGYKVFWTRQRRQRELFLLELCQPILCALPALVDAVNADAVGGACNMQAPIPGSPHGQRLSVQAVVPGPADNLYPAFNITR